MKKTINRAKLLNPIVLVIYTIACYYLAQLARYGGISRRVPIIIATFILLFSWFIYAIYKTRKQKDTQQTQKPDEKFMKIIRLWSYIAPLLIGGITLSTGYHIYQSSIPYNGKLSWYLQEFNSEREVAFDRNNIYKDGLNGLVEAVREEVDLPEELYIAEDVTLTFTSDGEITDFYGFLYGQDEAGGTDTYLITYDENKSDQLEIHLDNYVDTTYDEDKKFQPLLNGLNTTAVYELFGDQTDKTLILSYGGFETRTDNFELTRYYDENGLVDRIRPRREIHVGYSFVIYFENLSFDFPTYFISYDPELIQEFDEQRALEEAQANDPNYFSEEEIAEETFLNEEVGYQLVILDAMTGSRYYGLRHTTDGGQNWNMLNSDPFLGSTGVADGIHFIDENLGFAILSHNGGANANLFRTADGGQTFERVVLSPVTVEINNREFNPFDYPELPYEENNQLILYVNQGIDGDYLNNARARYVSDDNGSTFEFIEIE